MNIVLTVFRELLLAGALGVVLVPAATLTGQGERLCDAIGGVYDATYLKPDRCAEGRWRELVRVAR